MHGSKDAAATPVPQSCSNVVWYQPVNLNSKFGHKNIWHSDESKFILSVIHMSTAHSTVNKSSAINEL